MTQQMRNGQHRSAFSKWLRETPELDPQKGSGLSIIDIDWCIHQFRDVVDSGGSREVQNMMFVEEKTHGAECSPPQRDTLHAAAQLIHSHVSRQPHRTVIKSQMTGQKVLLRNWGFHLLRFSHSGPMDSVWIEWDRKRITLKQLIEILRFELSPLTLNPRDERRHHGGAKQSKMPWADTERRY